MQLAELFYYTLLVSQGLVTINGGSIRAFHLITDIILYEALICVSSFFLKLRPQQGELLFGAGFFRIGIMLRFILMLNLLLGILICTPLAAIYIHRHERLALLLFLMLRLYSDSWIDFVTHGYPVGTLDFRVIVRLTPRFLEYLSALLYVFTNRFAHHRCSLI